MVDQSIFLEEQHFSALAVGSRAYNIQARAARNRRPVMAGSDSSRYQG